MVVKGGVSMVQTKWDVPPAGQREDQKRWDDM